MTVRVRRYRQGGFEVDIRFVWPDGTPYRERKKAPVSSRTAATRWGEAREAELLRAGPAARTLQLPQPQEPKEVPTLRIFRDRYIEGYVDANRQKASTKAAVNRILRLHLEPHLGETRLDQVSDEQVQQLKGRLSKHSPKTVNNVLSVLTGMLRVAVKWRVIDRMPVDVDLLNVPPPAFRFYEFDDYARLVEAAAKVDKRAHVMVLLGGDAGLRRGEIISLRQHHVDLKRQQVTIALSDWEGIEDSPKGGRSRVVPMTRALSAALQGNRHLRGDRVLYGDEGLPVSPNVLRRWMAASQHRAGLAVDGGLHPLRHTFCSHLAMRGAPPKTIQELAGHTSLTTTMRYMHLSPDARREAIELLDRSRLAPGTGANFGDIVETAASSGARSS